MPTDAPKEVLEEVKNEYEKTVVAPSSKPVPQWMLMPVGVVGSGKTTVVKPLAERLDLIRISTDEIRERLKRRGYGYAGSVELATVLGKKYLSMGYSVAFDANTGSTRGLQLNAEVHEEFPEAPQIFIHINPPDEFVINKLKNYPHTWLFKNGEHAVEQFLKNKAEFIVPNLPFVYTFDTSKQNLSEQLDEAVEAIKNALKNSKVAA